MAEGALTDDPKRLFGRFRAIVVCAFLGLVVVAGVMITMGAAVEERRDRQILTELLRGHAFLLNSQAVAFRNAAEAAAERLRASLAPLARAPETWAERGCASAEAATMRHLDVRFAGSPPPEAAQPPRGAAKDWDAAVASVRFVAVDMETAAPNISRLMFIAPDGRAAAWLGRPPGPAEAASIIRPAACDRNPTGAAIWAVEPGPASPLDAEAGGCASGAAVSAIRLLRPVDIDDWRAGYLALELDACAIRRMNADLAVDQGHAFLVAGADAVVGAPRYAAPVTRLGDALDLHPSTLRAARAPFAQPAGDLTEEDGRLIFVQPLSAAPWAMIAAIDTRDLRARAFWETAGRLLLMLTLIAGALLMMVVVTRREFIDPAGALVADIVARGAGEEPGPSVQPPGWRPYFARIRDVFRENTEAAALRRELSIAARMQASILPASFPGPEAPLAVWGAAVPAREVGGDFFDLFDLPSGEMAVVIADVSGKGVPAALFMVLSRTVLRAVAAEGDPPAITLSKVNRLLAADNPETMFVTLFYGVIDPATGRMAYANAGHNPPYLIGADGAARPLPSAGGPALAVFEDAPYQDAECVIAPGETLVMYTDGVTEAMDVDDEEFGEARLEAELPALAGATPETAGRRIEAAALAFAGAAPQADDLTLMIVRRAEGPGPFTARLGHDLVEIPAFAARLEEWGAKAGLGGEAVQALSLSLDELMTNAIEYGAGGAPEPGFAMEVEVRREGDQAVAVLTDNGAPFDPFSAAPPDLESAAEDRRIGGLGVHFVRTLMNAYAYERRGGRNIVTLTRSLTGEPVP